MSARAILAIAMVLFGTFFTAPASKAQIQPSDLAGRERQQLIDPFPQRERAGPVVRMPSDVRPAKKRKCRVKGSRKGRAC